MDPATHTLTGLFLSRAGLNRFTKDATPILLLAASAPDCDVVSALGGAANYLHWHRNLTHSIALAPVLALLIVTLFKVARRPISFGPAYAVALAGIASHLLLDTTNNYGVRLLLPFSGAWFHWDLTPVIDLCIWGVFLVCLAGSFLSKLVTSEMAGSSPHLRKYPGRGFAIFGLVFLLTYNLGRMTIHARVIETLESREYEGSPPVRVAAFPVSENPFRWKGLAETSVSYRSFDMDALSQFDPAVGETVPKVEASPAIEAANRTPAFEAMREFAAYPWYRVIPGAGFEGGYRVELSDMRFDFTSMALLDRDNKVHKAEFHFSPQ